MKLLILLVSLCLLLVGCGGGGGGTPATIFLSGTVLSISNNGAPVPAAQVTIAGTTVATESDGFFGIEVPAGQTAMSVAWNSMTFDFTFPAAAEDRDLGLFFVGPQKVTVNGVVRNQNDNSPIAGAEVKLGGIRTTTDGSGNYVLVGVAYDPAQPANFQAMEGRAGKSGFFPRIFTPDALPVSGIASLGDVLLLPDSGVAPPGTPFNIEGLVNPSGSGVGATVQLKLGSTVVRQMTTGSDRRFGFWVAPGSYTVTATNGTLTSGPVPVVLNSPGDTVQQNVTLN
ncbi:MAG: carboxypeptidase regulatory-like domain-containing protein [Chthonomonas sp.]|nr:carboxypeptidase regulatory-like domain-containing protein [Chthonomonas sp.]